MEILLNILCCWVLLVFYMDSERHTARKRQERDDEVQ
jgi:hypothetical protein